jgi:hypothetical protein
MTSICPFVTEPIEYGSDLSGFWVEYPSGLVDISRSHHIPPETSPGNPANAPALKEGQAEISVGHGRTIRIDTKATAMVIVDMQKSVPPLQSCMYFQ